MCLILFVLFSILTQNLLTCFKYLGNSGNFEDLPPIFMGQASPYLSPFVGSLSPELCGSYEDIGDFKLEQEGSYYNGASISQISPNIDDDILLNSREFVSEAIIKLQMPKEEKSEIQTPTYLAKANNSQVYSIIEFLTQSSDLPENSLKTMAKTLCNGQQNLEYIFGVLLTKFKKLRKTKQEMIKYCMRKAFKFFQESTKKNALKTKNSSKSQKGIERVPSMQMPFRKNSAQKTMNSQFLKQTFSNKDFVNVYYNFLNQITEIIQEDNTCKIQYLALMIEKMIAKNEVKSIEKVKRLPWSRIILKKTEQLAQGLLQYADGTTNFMDNIKQMEQHEYSYHSVQVNIQ